MNKELEHDWKLIAIDELGFCNNAVKKLCKAAYSLYLYDSSLHVHICSATKNFEMYHAGTYLDPKSSELSEDELELLSSWECDFNCDAEPVTYMTASSVNKLPENLTQELDLEALGIDEDDVPDDFVRDLLHTGELDPSFMCE